MSNKERAHRYTSEEKLKAVRRHLVGKEPVSKICDELKIQPSVFYKWQEYLFTRGGEAFAAPGRPSGSRERELEERIAKLEAKLARKDAVIAEISAEYVQLKKELGEP